MLQKVKISLIKQDGGTQSRERMNPEAIQEYAASMADGAEFPPVVLFYDGDSYWLGDGFHRVAAALEAKQKTIAAEVHGGGFRDAILYAVGANAVHGLRRTNADKRRSVSRLLDDQEWSQWSNREIARRCGVSDPFVMQMRSERVLTVSTPGVATVATSKAKPEPEEEAETEPITTAEQVREIGREALAPKVITDVSVLAAGFGTPAAPAKDDRDARIAELVRKLAEAQAQIGDLTAENAELKDHLQQMIAFNDSAKEELESLHRIVDAEDILGQFRSEVVRHQELSRVLTSRNNGLMTENADLTSRLRSALRKNERLQKTAKEDSDQGPGPTEEAEYSAALEGEAAS